MSEPITSLQNPRIKDLVRLRNRRERDRTGTFLIEGYRELTKAADAGVVIRDVYHAPDLYLGENEPGLLDRIIAGGAVATELGVDAFRKVAYRDRPEGLLAVATQFPTSLDDLTLPAEPLVLVVESIEKPGNLGTMLRTADAAGVSAVIVCDPATDPFNPNAVRASIGSLFSVPLAITTTDDAMPWLHAQEIRTVATTPDVERLHWEANYRGAVALVIGSEQFGLSPAWLAEATEAVRIPMAGAADSLNAAMATGVMLFEAVRQRTVR
jgi:TrmH family RNA methyltransferase